MFELNLFFVSSCYLLFFNFLFRETIKKTILDVPNVRIAAKAIKTYQNGLTGSLTSVKPLTSGNCQMIELVVLSLIHI